VIVRSRLRKLVAKELKTLVTDCARYVAKQLRRNLSPLRYPGGKRRFAPYLSSAIALNDLKGCRYLEPYAGGAGAALELLRSGMVSSVFINDKDPAVYWFWRAALTDGERMIEQIETVKLNVDEWRLQRQTLRLKARGFELGFAAFYLNRTCMSGVIKRCGGPIGGYDQSGKYKIHCRFHRESLTAKIKFLHDNKSQIVVSNMDALTFLKKHAREKNLSVTYLDPPYYHKASELYLNSYTHSDHQKLRDFLLGEYHEHYWILSYDLCPEVLELYRHHRHSTIRAHHALANNGPRKEFITFSDRMKFPSTSKI
jgi:DNA adenine methylase